MKDDKPPSTSSSTNTAPVYGVGRGTRWLPQCHICFEETLAGLSSGYVTLAAVR